MKITWAIGFVLVAIIGLSFILTDPADLIHTSDDVKEIGWIIFAASLVLLLVFSYAVTYSL